MLQRNARLIKNLKILFWSNRLVAFCLVGLFCIWWFLLHYIKKKFFCFLTTEKCQSELCGDKTCQVYEVCGKDVFGDPACQCPEGRNGPQCQNIIPLCTGSKCPVGQYFIHSLSSVSLWLNFVNSLFAQPVWLYFIIFSPDVILCG